MLFCWTNLECFIITMASSWLIRWKFSKRTSRKLLLRIKWMLLMLIYPLTINMFLSLYVKKVTRITTWRLSITSKYQYLTTPSFRLSDNSVYLQECSPFWVSIFITFNKESYHVYCFMSTCTFWLTKNWSISICYRKV